MLVLQPGESDRRKVPAETGTKNDWRLCDVPRIGSANSRKTAGRKPNKTSDLQGGKIAAREPPPRAAIDCRAHLNGWRGAVAQMGERCNRTAEVRGSIPLSSMRRWSRVVAAMGARNPAGCSLPLGVTGNTPDSGS